MLYEPVNPDFLNGCHQVGSGRYRAVIASIGIGGRGTRVYESYGHLSKREWDFTGLMKYTHLEDGSVDLSLQIKYTRRQIDHIEVTVRFPLRPARRAVYKEVEEYKWVHERHFFFIYVPREEVISCEC
jgi:hypothetical protein